MLGSGFFIGKNKTGWKMNRFATNAQGKQFAGCYDKNNNPLFEGDRYTKSDSFRGLFYRVVALEIIWDKTGFAEMVVEADNGIADEMTHEKMMSGNLSEEQRKLIDFHPCGKDGWHTGGFQAGMYKVGAIYALSIRLQEDGEYKTDWVKNEVELNMENSSRREGGLCNNNGKMIVTG
jgi:hypothetical protein